MWQCSNATTQLQPTGGAHDGDEENLHGADVVTMPRYTTLGQGCKQISIALSCHHNQNMLIEVEQTYNRKKKKKKQLKPNKNSIKQITILFGCVIWVWANVGFGGYMFHWDL